MRVDIAAESATGLPPKRPYRGSNVSLFSDSGKNGNCIHARYALHPLHASSVADSVFSDTAQGLKRLV